jgi:tRNA 2-thiocytidine biosynthesis protein TtcA
VGTNIGATQPAVFWAFCSIWTGPEQLNLCFLQLLYCRRAPAGLQGGAYTSKDDIVSHMQSESLESARLQARLLKKVVQASIDFSLIERGDKILVAVSGGKDSHVMLHLLAALRKRTPFPFSLVALNIDQGQPDFQGEVLARYFEAMGYEYRVVKDDTYSIVKEQTGPGKTPCSLCSRLRRGILYTQASALGATKIALGHHRDDLVETLLLNLMFSGQIKAMPARLRSDDGQHVVIRPLVYCAEVEILRYAISMAFPLVRGSLCVEQDNSQRARVKALIAQLSKENPNVLSNMLAALARVRPTHLLDRDLLRRLGNTGGPA